jgi:hypothetical protein
MGPQRLAGDREQLGAHIGVDGREQLVDGGPPRLAQRLSHRGLTGQPVGDHTVDGFGGIDEERSVTGDDGGDGRLEEAHTTEAAEVLRHVTVGRPDDDGRPSHDVIPGEEHRLLGEQPAQVVRRVTRGVQRSQ